MKIGVTPFLKTNHPIFYLFNPSLGFYAFLWEKFVLTPSLLLPFCENFEKGRKGAGGVKH